MSIYDINILKRNGSEVSMSEYKGKVLLIVNTAIKCGFTPQYAGLQELYVKYKDQGLEILDFPCDQFAHQAPGTNEEIYAFCTGRFGITFPQFAKIEVNGDKEAPLYTFLKGQTGGKNIKWNFSKFLIARDGTVVERFGSMTKPEKLDEKVAKLL